MRWIFLSMLMFNGVPQEANEKPVSPKLIVHEWGTFTTVAGSDGGALEWRPLAGPSDLPRFVYPTGTGQDGLRFGSPCAGCSHFTCSCGPDCGEGGECNRCKTCIVGTVRMETPVLYFYADEETDVSVKVDFPNGRITEWYPSARSVENGIDWGKFRILPKAKPTFLTEEGESHYYPARETDAAPLRVCGRNGNEFEKFLFYRGVGTFDLPIQVTMEGDHVRVKYTGRENLQRGILFDNRNGQIRYGLWCGSPKGEILFKRLHSGNVDVVSRVLWKMLQCSGLYEKEAVAMIKTWKDTWFEPGLRFIYIVPREETDRILPIQIEPRPTELQRVLVGRVELITPELKTRIRTLVRELDMESITDRDRAHQELEKLGRFAEPVLKEMLEGSDDEEVLTRIRALLGSR